MQKRKIRAGKYEIHVPGALPYTVEKIGGNWEVNNTIRVVHVAPTLKAAIKEIEKIEQDAAAKAKKVDPETAQAIKDAEANGETVIAVLDYNVDEAAKSIGGEVVRAEYPDPKPEVVAPPACQRCKKTLDVQESVRKYGELHWITKFCSPQCYTKQSQKEPAPVTVAGCVKCHVEPAEDGGEMCFNCRVRNNDAENKQRFIKSLKKLMLKHGVGVLYHYDRINETVDQYIENMPKRDIDTYIDGLIERM